MYNDIDMSLGFFIEFKKLEKTIQAKFEHTLFVLKEHPDSNGLKFEPVRGCPKEKISSVRVDHGYRGILARLNGGRLRFIGINHHKYKRVGSKGYDTGISISKLYDQENAETTEDAEDSVCFLKYIFAKIDDGKFLKIGVPENLLDKVKSIGEYDDLEKLKPEISQCLYEYLLNIALGTSIDEIIDIEVELKREEKASREQENVREEPKTACVPDNEEELQKMLDGPLEDWRVFLHSSQRDLVRKDFNGPAKLLGSAGTGKTVVAMHRANRLAKDGKVLFCVYNKYLPKDIEANLKKICPYNCLNNISVKCLYSLVIDYLKRQKCDYEILDDEKNNLDDYWKQAIKFAYTDVLNEKPQFKSTSFYKDEWAQVIVPSEAFSEEDYTGIRFRYGRGTPVSKKEKRGVWKIVQEYMNILDSEHKIDIYYAMYVCKTLLDVDDNPPRYNHIIVDECQDFGNTAYQIIRALAGPEHTNDIFIVGDPNQNIYNKRVSLSGAGINVKGKCIPLKINYRTSDETRKFADKVVSDIYCSDMDEGKYERVECKSLFHGSDPVVKAFSTKGNEINFLKTEIAKLVSDKKAEPKDICIVARKKTLVKDYENKLGISSYRINDSRAEDRTFNKIRFSTMHSVKGLEFKYIFIVSADENTIPLKSLVNNVGITNKKALINLEKDLLYVAISRAQAGVYITCSGTMTPYI